MLTAGWCSEPVRGAERESLSVFLFVGANVLKKLLAISYQLSAGAIALVGVVCFLWKPALRAETIDRIAVSVGNRVITASDLDKQIRVAAFLSGTVADFTAKGKRAIADRLVEQRLIQNEIEMTHYVEPQTSAIEPALRQFIAKYFKTSGEYQAALAKAGLTDRDVRDELLQERTVNAFIEVRFHPAVQVTEEQIRDYFEKTVAPAATSGEALTLERFHDEIERTLTSKQVDAAVDQWVREARRRTTIVYHDEAFQ
jgi:hypothetical protein